jgi:hypothetical protein
MVVQIMMKTRQQLCILVKTRTNLIKPRRITTSHEISMSTPPIAEVTPLYWRHPTWRVPTSHQRGVYPPLGLCNSVEIKAIGEIAPWRIKLWRSYGLSCSDIVLVHVSPLFRPALTGLFVYLEVGGSSETFDEHSQGIKTENKFDCCQYRLL